MRVTSLAGLGFRDDEDLMSDVALVLDGGVRPARAHEVAWEEDGGVVSAFKSGWLMKKGGNSGRWQRRWFVLTCNVLN